MSRSFAHGEARGNTQSTQGTHNVVFFRAHQEADEKADEKAHQKADEKADEKAQDTLLSMYRRTVSSKQVQPNMTQFYCYEARSPLLRRGNFLAWMFAQNAHKLYPEMMAEQLHSVVFCVDMDADTLMKERKSACEQIKNIQGSQNELRGVWNFVVTGTSPSEEDRRELAGQIAALCTEAGLNEVVVDRDIYFYDPSQDKDGTAVKTILDQIILNNIGLKALFKMLPDTSCKEDIKEIIKYVANVQDFVMVCEALSTDIRDASPAHINEIKGLVVELFEILVEKRFNTYEHVKPLIALYENLNATLTNGAGPFHLLLKEMNCFHLGYGKTATYEKIANLLATQITLLECRYVRGMLEKEEDITAYDCYPKKNKLYDKQHNRWGGIFSSASPAGMALHNEIVNHGGTQKQKLFEYFGVAEHNNNQYFKPGVARF